MRLSGTGWSLQPVWGEWEISYQISDYPSPQIMKCGAWQDALTCRVCIPIDRCRLDHEGEQDRMILPASVWWLSDFISDIRLPKPPNNQRRTWKDAWSLGQYIPVDWCRLDQEVERDTRIPPTCVCGVSERFHIRYLFTQAHEWSNEGLAGSLNMQRMYAYGSV